MWDPAEYERFADERSRPFFELVDRVGAERPATVVDLGCGTGALTATLARRWPEAAIEGLDSSRRMIAEAVRRAVPGRPRLPGGRVGDDLPARPPRPRPGAGVDEGDRAAAGARRPGRGARPRGLPGRVRGAAARGVPGPAPRDRAAVPPAVRGGAPGRGACYNLCMRVTVWGENVHERRDASVAAIYPDGMHEAIADGIREHLGGDAVVGTATLDQPGNGLGPEVLDATDVLTWWGHAAHDHVA